MLQISNINNIDESQMLNEDIKKSKYIIKYKIDKEIHYIEFFGQNNIFAVDIKYILKNNKDLEIIIRQKLFLKKNVYEDCINNSTIIDINNIKIDVNDNIISGIYYIFIESEVKNNCIVQLKLYK